MPLISWLLRALLIILLVRAVWRFVQGVLQGARGAGGPRRVPREPTAVPLVRDPVCGTYLPKERALRQLAGREVHYFCSETCRERWLEAQRGRKAV
jgi:YHS domain-containing protein